MDHHQTKVDQQKSEMLDEEYNIQVRHGHGAIRPLRSMACIVTAVIN